jgi:hypothetical protein
MKSGAVAMGVSLDCRLGSLAGKIGGKKSASVPLEARAVHIAFKTDGKWVELLVIANTGAADDAISRPEHFQKPKPL